MSYDRLQRARIARSLSRGIALTLLGALAACAADPPAPTAPAIPGHAMPAKGGKQESAASIAFTLNGPTGQNVFVMDSLGTRLEQLTFGGIDDTPTWSPDRRKIAFVRGDGQERLIHIKTLSSGRETPVGSGHQPSWSPDGKQLAFTRMVDGNQDIYLMNVDGSNVRRLTTDAAHDGEPHWAPDGLSIAFTSDRTGTAEVFVMASDGNGQTRRTFCGPSYYCVSPKPSPVVGDLRTAFHQGTYSNGSAPLVSAIKILDPNSGTTTLVDGGVLLYGQPSWSPDAKRIVFIGQFAGQSTPVIYSVKVDASALNWYPQTVGSIAGAPAWAR